MTFAKRNMKNENERKKVSRNYAEKKQLSQIKVTILRHFHLKNFQYQLHKVLF